MSNTNDWMLKRTYRSVDALRPWSANPRYIIDVKSPTTMDYVEVLIERKADRDSFVDLIKSLATLGFIPADPIVVWQKENQKYYIAEGNRRILALKVLRYPNKAPRSIRGIVQSLAKTINRNEFEKVPVCVAPTLEDAEWYITQRNSISSLQSKWSAEQQRRWVAEIFQKYNGNFEIVKSKTQIDEAELQSILRLLEFKNFIKKMDKHLTKEEYESACSHFFPLTNIERFFSSTDVRTKWFIELDGSKVILNCEHDSFLNAYSQLVKRMLLPTGDVNRIDSRTMNSALDIKIILDQLPPVLPKTKNVSFDNSTNENDQKNTTDVEKNDSEDTKNKAENNSKISNEEEKRKAKILERKQISNDPNRKNIIPPFYVVDSKNYKLVTLFKELQKIKTKDHVFCSAAGLRVLIDISILDYIENYGLVDAILEFYPRAGELRNVELKKRVEYIKQVIGDDSVRKICDKLTKPENDFSLDVLNGFMHSKVAYYNDATFLNRFWDFLFPLFQKLITINEKPL